MAYTTIDKPSDYFNTNLYTGNNTETSHTVGFQPDWTWLKVRNADGSHYLFDSVRGVTKYIQANSTAAEGTDSNLIKSFDANGYTIGTSNAVNSTGETMVGWNWKAGTSFTNDASSTGIGTIDSTGSVNQDAGFSICSYTGTGSAGTIKHGLNSTPSAIILKNRIDGSVFWYVYHKSLGNNSEMYLNGTDAAPGSTGAWNTTSPTSSVFSVGSHGGTNASGQGIIAYCFAEKQGYSKFGSYTGNGNADGTFVYTGFKPAFTIIKSTGSDKWSMFDAKRNPFNEVDLNIRANQSDAEVDQAGKEVDYLSNGVKLRTSSGEWNTSGTQYIFMSFAENPFVSSTGVPATAR